MQLLFESWRNFLNEGIHPRISSMLDKYSQLPHAKVEISFEGNGASVRLAHSNYDSAGSISFTADLFSNGECLGAMRISSARAKGFGPMAYDIVIEVASIMGSGIIADRVAVSKDAFAVWEKYLNMRTDILKKQLDSTPYPFVTKADTSDDCGIGPSSKHYGTKIGINMDKDPSPEEMAKFVDSDGDEGKGELAQDYKDYITQEDPMMKFYYKASYDVLCWLAKRDMIELKGNVPNEVASFIEGCKDKEK